jgi:hypothetical protein
LKLPADATRLMHKVAALQPATRGQEPRDGSRSREDSDRLGGKVNTINKRTVGAQRVIKNSQQEDLRAHHPDAPSDNDRTG